VLHDGIGTMDLILSSGAGTRNIGKRSERASLSGTEEHPLCISNPK
jgi:hypothetical protein